MAVPKRKTSKARRDKRRTHKKQAAPNLTTCPECGESMKPHRACPSCGAYRGRNIIEPEE